MKFSDSHDLRQNVRESDNELALEKTDSFPLQIQ